MEQLNFVYQLVHQLQPQDDQVSGWAAWQIVSSENTFEFSLTLMTLLTNFHELSAGFHMSGKYGNCISGWFQFVWNIILDLDQTFEKWCARSGLVLIV